MLKKENNLIFEAYVNGSSHALILDMWESRGETGIDEVHELTGVSSVEDACNEVIHNDGGNVGSVDEAAGIGVINIDDHGGEHFRVVLLPQNPFYKSVLDHDGNYYDWPEYDSFIEYLRDHGA